MRRLSVITLLAALVAAACAASAGAKDYGPYGFSFKLVGPRTVQVTMIYHGYQNEPALVSYSVSDSSRSVSLQSQASSNMRVAIDTPASAHAFRTVTFVAGRQHHGSRSVFTVKITDAKASSGFCLLSVAIAHEVEHKFDEGDFCSK